MTGAAALDAPGVAVDVDGLLALRHLAAGRGASQSLTALPGGFVHRRRGRGLEMADLRVFEEGDDMRHIDRNATARTGIPHVRMFQDERDRTTLLLADFRAPMLWGTRRAFRSVAAAEHLALTGWRAMAEGGRVGLIAFGGPEPLFVPARGRERAMIAVIGGLAQAHRAALTAQGSGDPPATQPLDGYLAMAEQIAPRGAAVCLASSLDTPGDEIESAITALAHRASLSVLHICDAFERMPITGAYPFETETGRRGLGLVGGDRGAQGTVPARLRALGIPLHEIDAAHAPDEAGEGARGF